MRRGLLLIGLLLVLVMSASMVSADATTTDAPPKAGTPADNECYPGGVLYREENQDGCPTLWYWKAGWFLARFNRGSISRADFPKEFVSVLPPLEKIASACWNNSAYIGSLDVSILYTGPANQKGNIQAFLSSNCTGTQIPIFGGKSFVVFANNSPDAVALCAAQGTPLFTKQLNAIGWSTAPANAYGCSVS